MVVLGSRTAKKAGGGGSGEPMDQPFEGEGADRATLRLNAYQDRLWKVPGCLAAACRGSAPGTADACPASRLPPSSAIPPALRAKDSVPRPGRQATPHPSTCHPLPPLQALAAGTSTPLVVVLVHNGPLDISELEASPRVGAILSAW